MTRRFGTALVWLAMASWASAETPVADIEGPTVVSPGETFTLDARHSISDLPLRWRLERVIVDPIFIFSQKIEGAKPVEWREGVLLRFRATGAPGTVYHFSVTARGIPPGEKTLDSESLNWNVTIAGGQPEPPPPGPIPPYVPPVPPPEPLPKPLAGRMFVSLVVDTNQMTPALAKVQEGPAIMAQRFPMDFKYSTYDVSIPEQKADLVARGVYPYVEKGGGVPCLVIQAPADAQGHALPVIFETSPMTEAGVIERIKFARAGGRTPTTSKAVKP